MYSFFVIYLIFAIIVVGSFFKKFRTLLGIISIGSIAFALYFLIGWSI